jgi:hypothetical protein
MRPYLEKSFTKIELVEWLRVMALCSNPSTTHRTKLNYAHFNAFPTYKLFCRKAVVIFTPTSSLFVSAFFFIQTQY